MVLTLRTVIQKLEFRLTWGVGRALGSPQPQVGDGFVAGGLKKCFSFVFASPSALGKRPATLGNVRGMVRAIQATSVTPLLVRIIVADLSDWAGVPSLPQCSMCIPLEASHSVEEDTHPR